VTSIQTGGSENGNDEVIQQNPGLTPISSQVHYTILFIWLIINKIIIDFQLYDVQPPRLDFSAPPPYEDCNPDFVKLPTYEEVQMEKRLEEQISPRLPVNFTVFIN